MCPAEYRGSRGTETVKSAFRYLPSLTLREVGRARPVASKPRLIPKQVEAGPLVGYRSSETRRAVWKVSDHKADGSGFNVRRVRYFCVQRSGDLDMIALAQREKVGLDGFRAVRIEGVRTRA